MQFASSIYLVIGLVACLALVWIYRRLQRSHQTLLRTFAAPKLVERLTASVSTRRRNLKLALLIVAVAGVFTALSRPQAGFRWEETHHRGIDILMAVDTSKSMLAHDVQPDRLTRAKLGIQDFVARLDGDRVGLIPFAGTAFLMCPLTLDYDAFRQSLNALDATLMPRGGTDLAAAIREAEAAFDQDANHRILVLITDGEDLEGEALAAAKTAAGRGITIHTVGVGTPAGELIPLAGSGFMKDEQGEIVKSRLDENMLRKIAGVTGGAYEPLGRQAQGLDAIYQQKLSLVPEEEFAQRMHRVPLEQFQWPLLLAILLLALEYGISDRRRVHRPAQKVVVTAGRRPGRTRGLAAALPMALFLASLLPEPIQASPHAAEQAYTEGDYPTAAAHYRDARAESPDDTTLAFNDGAASYKTGDFAGAVDAFQTALTDEDLELQGQAYYNLGNTLYRQGQQTEQLDPQQTIQQWRQALTAYEGTLALNHQDEDARFNHDLVKRRLEELQQQQEGQNRDSEGAPPEEEEGEPDAGNGDQEEPGDEGGDQESEGSEGSEGEEQEQPATPGPEGNESPAQPESASNQSGAGEPEQQNPQAAGGERGQPGQMTPEEAEALLDSLKGDEAEAPFLPTSQGAGGAPDENTWRDW